MAQGLVEPVLDDPDEVVRQAGAMQGQDGPGVLASIALRTSGGTIEPVVEAFNTGRLVRGYPMRGTVFAVAAEDIIWMTQLCAGPALRAAVRRRAALGLEEYHFTLAAQVLQDQPTGGTTREAMMQAWNQAGIDTTQGRGYHVLAHLIGTGHAVHGAVVDGGFAVHRASDWLPSGTDLEAKFNGDLVAATAELFGRYARSRGPVTVRDFAWWTKLPLAQVRRAVTLCAESLDHDQGTEEPRYWRPGLFDQVEKLSDRIDRGRLLPGFDEFILGYQDRTFAIAPEHHDRLVPGNNGIFQKGALRGGRVVGIWKRAGRAGRTADGVSRRTLEVDTFEPVGQGVRRQWQHCFEQFPFLTD